MVCIGVLCSLVVWVFLVWCSMTWYVFWYGRSCVVACCSDVVCFGVVMWFGMFGCGVVSSGEVYCFVVWWCVLV